MKLTMRKSVYLNDWYVIERAEHDGRTWPKPIDGGFALCMSSRFSDADVEGDADEMRGIAGAIESGGEYHAKRCAVDATGDVAMFWSPRNSQKRGEVPMSDAVALAVEIRKAFAAEVAT